MSNVGRFICLKIGFLILLNAPFRQQLFAEVSDLTKQVKAQLYNLLGSSVINIQDYKNAYVNAYGNSTNFQDIATNNGVTP